MNKKSAERSWVYCNTMSCFEKEGRKLWERHVKPNLADLRKDGSLAEILSSYEEESILNAEDKFICPSFPIELLKEEYSFLPEPDRMRSILIYYAWRRVIMGLFENDLQFAIGKGWIDPLESSWCQQCGKCCIAGAAGAIIITHNDKNRIAEYLKEVNIDPFGSDSWEANECESRLDVILDSLELLDEGEIETNDPEGYPVVMLACPFLERFDSRRSLCSINPVKPECCRNYKEEDCRQDF